MALQSLPALGVRAPNLLDAVYKGTMLREASERTEMMRLQREATAQRAGQEKLRLAMNDLAPLAVSSQTDEEWNLGLKTIGSTHGVDTSPWEGRPEFRDMLRNLYQEQSTPDSIRKLETLQDRPDLAALDQQQRAAGAPKVSVDTSPPTLSYDDEGRAVLGGGSGQPLGTAGKNALDKEIQVLGDQLQMVTDIRMRFKPQFQQFGPRIEMAWNAAKEKMGVELGDEDKTILAEFTQYAAESGQFLSEYLSALSGAAVTESEAKRAQKFLPNPDDSPTEFMAKVERFERFAKLAIARKRIAKLRGVEWSSMTTDFVAKQLTDATRTFATEIRTANPDASREEVLQQARERVSQEFNIPMM